MMTKTALSWQATARNWFGNLAFMVANGHLTSSIFGRMRSAFGVYPAVFNRGAAATRARVQRYIQLGIVGDATVENVINELIGDDPSKRKAFDRAVRTNFFSKLFDNAKTTVTRFYGAQDDFWKVVAFENEVIRVARYRPTATRAQIEEEAADIVRNTMPTYSRAPEAVRQLRRIPFLAPFVTFSSEVWRTSIGVTRIGLQHIAEGRATNNPEMIRSGVTRLFGMSLALIGIAALAKAAQHALTDFTDEDEDDLRRHVPVWEEDAQLLVLDRDTETGAIRYQNLTYLNPYDLIIRPFRAAVRKIKDPDAGGIEAVKSFISNLFDPVAKEQIFFGSVVDTLRGVDAGGKKIYDETDPALQRTMKSLEHIYKSALEPGTLSSIERIWKGINQEVSTSGRKFERNQELLSFALGMKIQSLDTNASLTYASRKFNFDQRDAAAAFTKRFKSTGTQSDKVIQQSYFEANRKREKAFLLLRQKLVSAVRLGSLSREEAIRIMQSERVSDDTMGAILNNYYPRYEPTIQTLEIAHEKGRELGQDRIQLWREVREDWPTIKYPLSKDDPENSVFTANVPSSQ